MTTNFEIDYDKLAQKIAKYTLNLDPRSLWTVADIASYVRKSQSYVYQLLALPTFPEGIRIDPESRTKVWKASEVMDWVTKNPKPKYSSLNELIAD